MLMNAPTLTDSVIQSFFIEALTGSQNPITYLDRFPDTIYTKSIDSLLVHFLYALLGPTGVGLLRQQGLRARLDIEEAGLSTVDLDAAYSNAFNFARLADETYELDASAALLNANERATILAQDASFRNRAINFLQGARAGGTVLGISRAAASGLNRPVEAIENYRALYDRYSDAPLGLKCIGSTTLANEVVIVPRQLQPTSAVQTLSISGEPARGWFTLTFPTAPPWLITPITTTAGSSTIQVQDLDRFPIGTFVSVTQLLSTVSQSQLDPTATNWPMPTTLAQSAGGTNNHVNLVHTLASAYPGTAVTTPQTGNYFAFVGVAQTTPLPFNASAGQIQDALMALPVIGRDNVLVTGGPLPDVPVQITFINALSDQAVPLLQANTTPDKVLGITMANTGGNEQMSDVLRNPIEIVANISMQTVGNSIDGQGTTIAPSDEHALRLAVDRIRPQTAIVTTRDGEGKTRRQEIASTFTGSSQTEVLRYVTGRADVRWPPVDDMHWIEDAQEHEAPRSFDSSVSGNYQGFHNIGVIRSYTNEALNDPNYANGATDLSTVYWDSLIGSFSLAQRLLVPALANLTAPNMQYLPPLALAAQPDPQVLSVVNGQGVVDDIYPTDYLTLPGITRPTSGSLWASNERTSGTDYLEIDLGQAQAVNFIYFEATRKPFGIDVTYDLIDQAPARSFVPTTIAPATVGPSITSLSYDVTMSNPWEPVTLYFNNSLNRMIYTRFIRIGFTRQPNGTPFATPAPVAPAVSQFSVIPYSIEVRNLRIGRSASST